MTRKGLMFSLVVCAILVGCSAVVLIRMGTAPTLKSLHRQRAEAVASIARKDDLVITLSYDRDAMLYYLRRAESEVVPRSFPRWLDDQIGWIDSQADLSDDRLVLADADAAALATLASQRLERGRRAFLLADSADPEGHGPRGQLHGLLGSKLQAAGLEAALIDDNMLVYEIRTAVAGDR